MVASKQVFAPHLGREVRLGGRITPRVPPHALKFAHLIHTAASDAPTPPTATNFAPSALASLREVYGNDSLGDCVCAGRAHRIGLLTGAAGNLFVYSTDQVVRDYSAIGGYVPGDASTDQGCDMTAAANYGVQTGYADGSKDVGWVSVNAADQREVALAFWIAENGDLGLALPAAWLDPFPITDDFVWDVAGDPVPENGHCVVVVDYDAIRGVRIATWGLLGWITWPALAKYAVESGGGELLVHLNADQVSKANAKAPDGFDWLTIVTFFDQDLGGAVPIPIPVPGPAPSGPVTLAQAQSWARDGISNGGPLMTRLSAGRLSDAGLAASWPKT